MGLEPTTSKATIWHSKPTELHSPINKLTEEGFEPSTFGL